MRLKPTALEIEAFYLNDKVHNSLSPRRFGEVAQYIRDHYLDGGTRKQFIAQRRRIEAQIARTP